MTVYKYPLALVTHQEVVLHGNATQFQVGLDPAGTLCVWALVDPDAGLTKRSFFIHGTGHVIDERALIAAPNSRRPKARNWLGTVKDGHCMWHVFTT